MALNSKELAIKIVAMVKADSKMSVPECSKINPISAEMVENLKQLFNNKKKIDIELLSMLSSAHNLGSSFVKDKKMLADESALLIDWESVKSLNSIILMLSRKDSSFIKSMLSLIVIALLRKNISLLPITNWSRYY